MTETLFGQPRRRTGASEALLAKTLRQWHADGYLAGDAWASARGVLRDAARAVDHGRQAMHDGEITARSFASIVKTYAELMQLYRQRDEGVTGDAIDSLIAEISGPPVRDTP